MSFPPPDWGYNLLVSTAEALKQCEVCDNIRIADHGYAPAPCGDTCPCHVVLSVVEGIVKPNPNECGRTYEAEVTIDYAVCRPVPETSTGVPDDRAERSAAHENARVRGLIAASVVAALNDGTISGFPKTLIARGCNGWTSRRWYPHETEGTCQTWRMVFVVSMPI